jgi:Ser/Thr protein kinase RdoA (MazF antagonist)
MTLPFARDPVFPQRDALFDPAFVATCLARQVEWAGRVTRAERVRATYRMGDSLRLRLRFEADGVDYNVAARAFRPGRSEHAFAKALAAAGGGAHGFAGILHSPENEAVFWLFPHDRRVAALSAMDGARATLSPQLPRPWVASRLVAWAPENSATFQCLDATGTVIAYAKVGARAHIEYDRYVALADALARTCVDLHIPRAIAFSAAHDTMLIEPVAGRLLTYEPRDMRAVGIALAQLHGLAVPDLPRFDRFQPDARRDTVELIARSLPSLGPVVEDLAAALTAGEIADDEPGCLHGDMHPKNVLINGSRAALIDVEEASWGPRAADLGSLLARLCCLRTMGGDARAADAAADALLDGYATVAPVPHASSVRWHTAAALLVERARRTMTRVYAGDFPYLDAQLTEAARLLT